MPGSIAYAGWSLVGPHVDKLRTSFKVSLTRPTVTLRDIRHSYKDVLDRIQPPDELLRDDFPKDLAKLVALERDHGQKLYGMCIVLAPRAMHWSRRMAYVAALETCLVAAGLDVVGWVWPPL